MDSYEGVAGWAHMRLVETAHLFLHTVGCGVWGSGAGIRQTSGCRQYHYLRGREQEIRDHLG